MDDNNKQKQSASPLKLRILSSLIKDVCYTLTAILCALRVCGVIHCAWFIVMAPIFFHWIMQFALLIAIGVIAILLDAQLKAEGNK